MMFHSVKVIVDVDPVLALYSLISYCFILMDIIQINILIYKNRNNCFYVFSIHSMTLLNNYAFQLRKRT